MFDRKPKSAKEVLSYATQRKALGENPTYVICGQGGPTGKTWLWNKLRESGYNAVEISECISWFVDYNDEDKTNHLLEGGHPFVSGSQYVLIILNKPLDGVWMG